MNRVANRFQRGSGIYQCRVCKRNTRQTGRGDNEHVQLCAQCFDLAGEGNSLSDYGELYCESTARNAIKFLTDLGIDAGALFPEVAAALAKLNETQSSDHA